MTIDRSSTLREVVFAVGGAPFRNSIRAVLTGGACASLHTRGADLSEGVDFVLQDRVSLVELDAAMGSAGSAL